MAPKSNKIKIRNWQKNLLLVMVSSFFALGLAEIVLRVVKPHNQYHSLLPKIDGDQYNPHHKFFPGIDSIFHISVNKWGYRSPSKFDDSRHGVLTIGGSTTYCIGLSDSDSWPWLLEERLNQSELGHDFTVGNIGVPAFSSGHHVLQLKHIEPQLQNIKTIILLVGVNDFMRFFVPIQDDDFFRRTFIQLPRKMGENWYKRTELWMHLKDLVNGYRKSKFANDTYSPTEQVKRYEIADKTNDLPDLQLTLNSYENNILEIIKLARERELKLVLVTQPVLWHEGMTKEQERLVNYVFRSIDGVAFTPLAMTKGMKIFNNKLRQIANQQNIDLIDLSNQLPQDTTVFFDHCHYNKSGAIKVAEVIYDELQTILNKKIAQGKINLDLRPLPNDRINDKP